MTATAKNETAKNETANISGKELYEKDFASDESGVGTIETVLILVVLISLVLIFQTQMKTIINNVFKTINSGVNDVRLK